MGDELLRQIHLYQLIILVFLITPVLWAKPKRLISTQSTIGDLTGQALLSSRDRDLEIVTIKLPGTSQHQHRFYAQASLHGNESYTTEFLSWLSVQIRQGKSSLNLLPEGSVIDFLLVANPDSFKKSRLNKNGVNLNRNFSVLWGKSDEPSGSEAFSEPETKAIRALFNHYQYTAAVDIHGYVNWVVMPSPPKAIKSTKSASVTPDYSSWTRALVSNSTILPNYLVKDAANLGDGGAFEDWAFWDKGVYAFCLEMHSPERFLKTQDDKIDLFQAYDRFIANVFAKAVTLKETAKRNTSKENPKQKDNPERVASKND